MTQNEAMEALSRQTGTTLAFNEQGLCRLRFDGRFIVDLEVADDETAIFLYSLSWPLARRGARQGTDGENDAGSLSGPGKRQDRFRAG